MASCHKREKMYHSKTKNSQTKKLKDEQNTFIHH